MSVGVGGAVVYAALDRALAAVNAANALVVEVDRLTNLVASEAAKGAADGVSQYAEELRREVVSTKAAVDAVVAKVGDLDRRLSDAAPSDILDSFKISFDDGLSPISIKDAVAALREALPVLASRDDLVLLRQEQVNGSAAAMEALRGGVASSLDTLAKMASMMALPAPAQRFSVFDDNLTDGQTSFVIVGGYAPGVLTVFKNGLLVSEIDYSAADGATLTLNYPAEINDVIEVRPNRGGGVLNAAPVVHTHSLGEIRGLTTAWLGALFTAWFTSLPVYSGDGPAPVSTGQPYNNAGRLEFAQ